MQDSPMPKHCPRCQGLMVLERDWYGEFGDCLACGYVHELQRATPEDLLKEEQLQEGKKRKRRAPSHGSGRGRVSL